MRGDTHDGYVQHDSGGLEMELPKHPVVHGHPLHAILSDRPAVLIPVAVAIEAWYETGRNRGRQTTDQRGLEERLARYSTVMASIAA
jgi:hypothetical protein